MKKADLKEKRTHSTRIIPYSYYHNLIPHNFSYSAPHWHPEFEISYMMEGELEVQVGSQSIKFRPGDIVIVQPNVLHSVYPSPAFQHDRIKSSYHTVVFSPSLLTCSPEERAFTNILAHIINGSITMTPHITENYPYYTEIRSTVENIISCCQGNTALLDLMLKGELFCLFYLILQYEKSTVHSPLNNFHMKFSPVINYIAEHYSEPIQLKQLAELSFLSQSHFMAQFKQYMGMSAMAYVSQIRIQNVCRMLTQTNQSLLTIAEACGFRNLSNFNEQFRKQMSCTPSEYRKRVERAIAQQPTE